MIVYILNLRITSIDVERSFSSYKNILFDNQRKSSFKNLNKPLLLKSI